MKAPRVYLDFEPTLASSRAGRPCHVAWAARPCSEGVRKLKCSQAHRVARLLLASALLPAAAAAPINTDTALPVHRGEILWREQVRFLKAEGAGRDLEVVAVPSVLVYGFTEKFALIAIAPHLDKTLQIGGAERGDRGFGDATLLARHQVWQVDRPGETIRAQLLAGLKFPTGRDDKRDSIGRLPPPLQLGSGSYDPIVAAVFSWQRLQWQADVDLIYKINTEANDFRFGNTLAHDAAFQYRLWPQTLSGGGVPSFVYGVFELNGVWTERNRFGGAKLPDSGGYTLFLSPGLQYVTQRWLAEIAVQFPVVQNLNGEQLEIDYTLVAGFRIQF